MKFYKSRRTAQLALLRLGLAHVNLRWPQRLEARRLIGDLGKRLAQTPAEAHQLYVVARAVGKLPGDMAELGVFAGGSARLICSAAPGKRLHLFDTFAGMPETDAIDVQFRQGTMRFPMEAVREYLSGRNVEFHPGVFPATTETVRDVSFCLVHLDADLYRSTLDALEFFHPRIVPGGIIVSHDYVMAEGPRAAFDEFFAAKTEPVIELSGNQCMVVKV